jgi:hypothetical protein
LKTKSNSVFDIFVGKHDCYTNTEVEFAEEEIDIFEKMESSEIYEKIEDDQESYESKFTDAFFQATEEESDN